LTGVVVKVMLFVAL